MGRYIVEVRQEITTPITVYADNADDAQKRAVYGLGEFGDPDASELQITSTRLLEEFGAKQ
ncbi:hypothetical protein HNQ57_003215 [Zhongshania antarctica]|uniref:Uncharacterized protein n=1 Tax=Zhongshania antarctica TaxID=641702 RepID=A0A840R8S3_9GAMM|nr:hypothetical protein [Zhongshania antarctica]MBB5188918.1 hypothetical protein [Zhongshania antarctica]